MDGDGTAQQAEPTDGAPFALQDISNRFSPITRICWGFDLSCTSRASARAASSAPPVLPRSEMFRDSYGGFCGKDATVALARMSLVRQALRPNRPAHPQSPRFEAWVPISVTL